jgi:hypothetical protein
MAKMAYRGQWQPLFDYLFERMKASMSLRDLITGEKSIQASGLAGQRYGRGRSADKRERYSLHGP